MEKIKLLVIKRDMNASDWHRMVYPLSKMQGLELEGKEIDVAFELFSEETLEKAKTFDIFVYNWDINLSLDQIKEIKEAGVKVLYVLDDYWKFSELHPYYGIEFLRNYVEKRVIEHLKLATAVIVTTERLMLHCKPYVNNIAILPNFLDPKDFKIEEKTTSDYLRVGLVNSLSHYPDMLMLKQVFNRICKNKDLVDKIELHICGYVKGDKHWEEIVSMFSKKKNLKLVLTEYVPLEDYINVYKNLDVCLLPLEYCEFNLTRSALKLLECALTKTVPVGSTLFSTKELKGIVVAESPLSYEEALITLLDKNCYNNVLNYITDINLKDNDYEKRFENTKAVIGAVYLMEENKETNESSSSGSSVQQAGESA